MDAQTTSACLVISGPISSGKISWQRLTPRPRLDEPHYTGLIINQPPAGVAQLVERVALITAKRSTSRSWVRAPPSAIPIS
jgi:hypothetical protein